MGSLRCFGLVTMQFLIVALGLVASAAAQYLPYPYAAGYPLLPYAVPVAPFVAHPNGALVPLEPKDVVDARAEHLQAVADALKPAERKRRSADAQFLASPVLPYTAGYALPYAAGYPFLPYVAPFVAHPNGAVVPLEPKDVVDARAEHLQAVADALKPAEE